MNFKPAGKNILLKKIEAEEVKKGILIMPENKKPKVLMCQVYGVGEKVELDLVGGNEVMIHPNAGLEIEYEGQPYIMVEEKHILGVVSACNNT